jgi:phosphate transport system substrate-binding protein
MKRIKIILILFAVVILSSCSGGAGRDGGYTASIQIKGSDTIVNLLQAWAEHFCEDKPSINIGITGGGSGTGFAALINRTCDIAMSSRVIEPSEVDLAKQNFVSPVEFTVGLDGLVILVNKRNPVNGLTLSQVKDIFTAKITNWKEVGGEDRPIVILSRESNSGTHLFFKEHVLRKGDKKDKTEFAPRALLMPSSQAIYNEIFLNPHALGYVGMGYINDNVKALKIAKDENSPYIYPDVYSVMEGAYPISRPLLLYTDKMPEGAVKEFIDFALSPEGQMIVKETDFVPLDENTQIKEY